MCGVEERRRALGELGAEQDPGSSSGIAYELFEATSVVPAITNGPPLAPAFISQSIPIPAGSIVASMIVVGESHVNSRSPSNGGSAG